MRTCAEYGFGELRRHGSFEPDEGGFFLFAFSTPCGVNRKPRRISFFADYALFEFTLGSGTQVSFAESEHRMRHNNKK